MAPGPAFRTLCLLAGGAFFLAGPAGAAELKLDLWRLDCSYAARGQALEAVSRAAAILQPCGIALKLRRESELKAGEEWCRLPWDEKARKKPLEAIAGPRRRMNPEGLSLFVVPKGGPDARYSFALIDKSDDAGCGSPREARFRPRFGSLFMTDFSFASPEEGFPGLLLAHEIAHALSMRPHPTRAPRGTLLADHLADIGSRILPEDCACMLQSPYLSSPQ